MIGFHGTADPIVPSEGGPLGDPLNPVKPLLPGAREFVGGWAKKNGCADGAVESTIAHDVERLRYPNCAEGADVILYTIIGGGHTWPGGKPLPRWWVGPTSNSMDATSRMWEFFRQHPLRHRRPAAAVANWRIFLHHRSW